MIDQPNNGGSVTDEKPSRKKDPKYVVLRVRKYENPDAKISGYELVVPQPISASSRKAAVAAAAKSNPVEGQATYIVIPAKEWLAIRHQAKTQTVDEFA